MKLRFVRSLSILGLSTLLLSGCIKIEVPAPKETQTSITVETETSTEKQPLETPKAVDETALETETTPATETVAETQAPEKTPEKEEQQANQASVEAPPLLETPEEPFAPNSSPVPATQGSLSLEEATQIALSQTASDGQVVTSVLTHYNNEPNYKFIILTSSKKYILFINATTGSVSNFKEIDIHGGNGNYYNGGGNYRGRR